MVLKLIGLGFRLYLRDGFNIFDGIIVIVGKATFLIGRADRVHEYFRLFWDHGIARIPPAAHLQDRQVLEHSAQTDSDSDLGKCTLLTV